MTLLAQTTAAAETIDTHWRLDATGAFTPAVTILIAAFAVAVVAWCYTREASPAGRAYRVLLGGLRLTTVALLMLMLSELLLSGTRSGRPRFAVLVDHSASMETLDPGADATRRVIAERVLADDGAGLLDRLRDDFDVEVFAVADGVAPITDPAEGKDESENDDKTDSGETPSQAVATGATRLGDAIDRLLNDGAAAPPQGVLLLTDGQNTAGRGLADAAEAARRGATPLYLIGVGADEAPPDIALTDLLADTAAYVDDLVSARATLRWRGKIGRPIRVTLRRAGSETALAEQTIDPAAHPGGSAPVQLIWQPNKPGALPLEIVADTVEAERDTGNNRVGHTLTVHDGKLKVLLVAGSPHYEFRYVKHLLERDQSVELSTLLQEAGPGYASADPTAIARFPVRRRELDAYDAVVLMDVDPRLLPRSVWPTLRGFVAEGGGGLALVAGPRSLPSACRGLPDFLALAPFDLDQAPLGRAAPESSFAVRPTEQGLRLAAMQLADTPAESLRVWKGLPPLYWRADLGPAKPAAQVLATHPSARGADGRPAPVIASHYFGAGRVLMHAFDATYRWRLRVGDVYFARYWVQTLRTLARGKLQGGAATELTVDRPRYAPGEPVRLRLERRAEAGAEGTPPQLLVESDRGPRRTIDLSPEPGARGLYSATLDRLPVGRYRALLSGDADGAGPVAAAFEITPPPGETARIERATNDMQAAAERSRGWYLPVEEAEKAAEQLPRGVLTPIETLPPVELWNRWWMLAAIVGCLSTEWILRKRRAML